MWSEGPAWCSQGRYLVWSDIPNNRQLRWIEDNGRVSVFRMPSNNSNGNTFDFQGRQISCEHLTRRVVRYEHDGSVTILADCLQRQAAQLAQRRRGRIRTAATGSPIRRTAASSTKERPISPGGASNQAGRIKHRLGQPPEVANLKRELPNSVYRVDPNGKIDLVVSEDQVPDPNGLVFSPDYKKLYVISTGRGPGDAARRRQSRHPCLRRGKRQQDLQPQALQRLHGRRRQVRARRRPLRRGRQSLGLEQCRPQPGLQRRDGVDARGQAHRPHPTARSVRQYRLRRAQAQPPVHGGQPVAVRALRRHAGCGALRRPPIASNRGGT